MQSSAQPPADVPTINSWARRWLLLLGSSTLSSTDTARRWLALLLHIIGSFFKNCYSAFESLQKNYTIFIDLEPLGRGFCTWIWNRAILLHLSLIWFFFKYFFGCEQQSWITEMNLSSVSLLTCCIIPAELARRSPVDTRPLADSFRTKRTGSVQVYTLNTSGRPESRVATESSRPMPSIGQLK